MKKIAKTIRMSPHLINNIQKLADLKSINFNDMVVSILNAVVLGNKYTDSSATTEAHMKELQDILKAL